MKKSFLFILIFITVAPCMKLSAGGQEEMSSLKIQSSYSGVCDIRSDRLKLNNAITDNSEYYKFLETIPLYEIGKGDMPKSKDPLLKKPKINFKKYMMIVVINPDFFKYSNVRFIDLVRTGDNLMVNYELNERAEQYTMQWARGISYYEAVIVEKVKGEIHFNRR